MKTYTGFSLGFICLTILYASILIQYPQPTSNLKLDLFSLIKLCVKRIQSIQT